jgi:hypothetical protein
MLKILPRINMPVTCKIGRYFRDINDARECARHHPGGCAQHYEKNFDTSIELKYPTRDKNKDETNISLVSEQFDTQKPRIANPNDCPAHKTQGFPCPRCFASKTISERGEFFKMTVFWECKYPMIVNLQMLTPEDIINMPQNPQ